MSWTDKGIETDRVRDLEEVPAVLDAEITTRRVLLPAELDSQLTRMRHVLGCSRGSLMRMLLAQGMANLIEQLYASPAAASEIRDEVKKHVLP